MAFARHLVILCLYPFRSKGKYISKQISLTCLKNSTNLGSQFVMREELVAPEDSWEPSHHESCGQGVTHHSWCLQSQFHIGNSPHLRSHTNSCDQTWFWRKTGYQYSQRTLLVCVIVDKNKGKEFEWNPCWDGGTALFIFCWCQPKTSYLHLSWLLKKKKKHKSVLFVNL